MVFAIIDNAKNRKLDCYSERHHIIPKSMQGTNDPSNLIRLTAKEHFVVHCLLIRMTSGKDRNKMLYALRSMCMKNGRPRYVSRLFAMHREQFSKAISETKKGQPAHNKGKKAPPVSDVTRQRISAANKGKGRKNWTDAQKAAHTERHTGFRHTAENRAKISAAAKAQWEARYRSQERN